MKKRILCRCMAAALAGCMFLQANVFAAEFSAEDTVIESADEIDLGETEVDSIDTDDAEIVDDSIDVVASAKVPDDQQEIEADDQVLQFADEELVGAEPKIELDTVYSFSCTSKEDAQIFPFTPERTAVYRVDVTGSKGKIVSRASFFKNKILYDAIDHHVYENNDLKYTVQLTAGRTYYFYAYPDTNRADSGEFKIREITTTINDAEIRFYKNRYLTVGHNGAGQWAVKKDGSTDYDVWLFTTEELRSLLFDIKLYLSDGTTMTWRSSTGYEVGDTGLLIVPEQITDDWKLDQDAFMYVYFGDQVTPEIKILYNNTFFKDVLDSSNPYYKAIYWAADNGITKGYNDGTFGIDRSCTRGEAVMFLWRLAGKPAPEAAATSPFKDVKTNHTFYKAILWASQAKVTTGYSDKTFRPNDTCTRGQIMTFIWRFKGKPAPKNVTKSPFSDVPKNHTYYKAILWGAQKKVTKGFADGTFGIDTDCSRGQIVTFLYRIK